MSQGRRLLARGGPLDGEEVFLVLRKGLLLLDRHTQILWIYDWDKQSDTLVLRETEGTPFDHEKSEKARMDGNYQILSISSQPLLERPAPPGEEMFI